MVLGEYSRMRRSERRYADRSPSGGSITLVPRPSTASPVNREPAFDEKNARWSGVWPGVAITDKEAEPAVTESPSRIRIIPSAGREANTGAPVTEASGIAPGAWSG